MKFSYAIMNPTLHSSATKNSAGHWLHHVLVQLAQQSVRDIHKIPQWEEQGVHNLRKRMKKLQSMLHLARSVVPDTIMGSIRKDVRDLKNLLSGQRDALVLAKVGEEFGAAIPPDAPKPDPAMGKLRKAIVLSEQLLTDIRALALSRLSWDLVAATYAKSYKSSRKAWQVAQDDPSPENLHDWRKKVKRLYYQSTALEPWFHHPKRLRLTRKLGSLLGDCHDLDVFTASAKSGRLHAPRNWKSKVRSRRSKLLSRVEQRADRLFSRSPRKVRAESRHSLA